MAVAAVVEATERHDLRLDGFVAGLDGLLEVRVDELSDGQIDRELLVVESARRRLDARVGRLTRARTHRAADRAERANPGDQRARERATRQARQEAAGLLNWTTGQVRSAESDGAQLEDMPHAAGAAERGEISTRHARILSETLEPLPEEVRRALEDELVEVAMTQNPVEFGRTCRRRLVEVDHEAAAERVEQQHARRRASVWQTEKGTVRVDGEWAGIDGEYILTAVNAFRRPDAPGQQRSSDQRTADALVDALRAALRSGDAQSGHGVRPHVTVTVDVATLLRGDGVAETGWSGPMPWAQLRRLLDDCGLSWLPVNGDGLPVASTAEARTVPTGLWRILRERDQGCIHVTCDRPPDWCDVMHLGDPHRRAGRLRPDTAGLGCRHHHTLFDQGKLILTWDDGRPMLKPRDGPDP